MCFCLVVTFCIGLLALQARVCNCQDGECLLKYLAELHVTVVCVYMVASDLLEGALTWRGEWRCVWEGTGALSVMIVGMQMRLL